MEREFGPRAQGQVKSDASSRCEQERNTSETGFLRNLTSQILRIPGLMLSAMHLRDHICAMRSEAEVFHYLAALCRSDGYGHALAHLCFRNNIVGYAEELSVEDLSPLLSSEGLIRSEISTLIGLMIQAEVNWRKPSAEVMQQQIDRTESLLQELHETFRPAMTAVLTEAMKSPNPELNPFERGGLLKEAIFYSGESAYNFQYRDFAPQKYIADDNWLRTNKGFSIRAARDVVRAVEKIQSEKIGSTLAQMARLQPSQWSILGGFTFDLSEVVTASGLEASTAKSVLDAFTGSTSRDTSCT